MYDQAMKIFTEKFEESKTLKMSWERYLEYWEKDFIERSRREFSYPSVEEMVALFSAKSPEFSNCFI
jgi:LPS O-antigen subunit length determinant protein (WzzB/FepE family)